MKTAQNRMMAPIVAETLGLMDELAKVMSDEIELVTKYDVSGIKETGLRKNRLVMDYQSKLKVLAAQPEILEKAAPEFLQRLKASGARLAEVTERNARAIRTAAECSQRLLNHIIKQVKDEALPKQGYDDPRKSALMLGSYSPTCRPVAVSQTA